jgi:hypothetical protein
MSGLLNVVKQRSEYYSPSDGDESPPADESPTPPDRKPGSDDGPFGI